MSLDLLPSRPVLDDLPAADLAPVEPPTRRRPGLVFGAIGLVLLLAVVAVLASWPQSSPHRPAPAGPGAATGPVQQGADLPSTPPSAPSSGAVPGARSGSSAGSAPVAKPQAAVTTGSDSEWKTRDSAVLTPSTAAYFIAGTIYGDPPANRPGVVTMTSSTLTHLRRGARSGPTLRQLQQAVQVLGGRVTLSSSKKGGGKAAFSLAAGHSIVLDTHGWVRIDGDDAFGLTKTATGWTSTATGPQVRAFLAGFIEGEGSVGGKIGDDPTSAHLAFVQSLMMTSQAYGVRTNLTGSRYFALWMSSAADDAKVQAYPFITYSRVPGGQPK